MKEIRFGYDDLGKKIYEGAEGYYYDESGMCHRVFPSTQLDKWDSKNNKYIAGTPGFDTKKYEKEIDTYLFNALERGFIFTQNNIPHIQKCRDREILLLTTTHTALKIIVEKTGDIKNNTAKWEHDPQDIQYYTLNTFEELLLTGTEFVTYCYSVAEHCKTNFGTIKNLSEFIAAINKISTIKVREVD